MSLRQAQLTIVLMADPMSDDGQFANKPFVKLLEHAFPDVQRKRETKGALAQEDRELFLREVWRKPPPPAKPAPGGFTLGEQCGLSRFSMKKKKGQAAAAGTHAQYICEMDKPEIAAAHIEAPMPDQKQQDADADIFATAMRNIKPLGGKGREVPPAKRQAPIHTDAHAAEESFAEQPEFALTYSDEYLEGYVTGMDGLILQRLRQGQFSPEGHLDLHGLNAEQAFEALKDFLRQAWFKGLRTVLIVPGRGRNSPAGLGILRQKLPYWLSHEPFKRLVLAFCTAQPHDGGTGSVYVLLRKARKKGPVRWQTASFDSDIF